MCSRLLLFSWVYSFITKLFDILDSFQDGLTAGDRPKGYVAARTRRFIPILCSLASDDLLYVCAYDTHHLCFSYSSRTFYFVLRMMEYGKTLGYFQDSAYIYYLVRTAADVVGGGINTMTAQSELHLVYSHPFSHSQQITRVCCDTSIHRSNHIFSIVLNIELLELLLCHYCFLLCKILKVLERFVNFHEFLNYCKMAFPPSPSKHIGKHRR